MIEIFGIFGILLIFFFFSFVVLAIVWNTFKLMFESLFIWMGDEQLKKKQQKELEDYWF